MLNVSLDENEIKFILNQLKRTNISEYTKYWEMRDYGISRSKMISKLEDLLPNSQGGKYSCRLPHCVHANNDARMV
jgi:hypothetical protein